MVVQCVAVVVATSVAVGEQVYVDETGLLSTLTAGTISGLQQ